MSVKAGINVVFKRRLPKYVEYAAVCGFGSPHSQKREWKKYSFWGGWENLSRLVRESKNKKLWPKCR